MNRRRVLLGNYLAKKQWSVFLLILLAICLLLQGCQEGTPIPEVIKEPTDQLVTKVIDPPEETPEWCVEDGALYAMLPALDPNAEGITVEICIFGGEAYTIETLAEIPKNLAETKGLKSPFDIHALIAYFKVKEGEVVVTSFENSLLMRITYTSDAWQEMIERDFEVPRIAFLPWDGGSWAKEWIELGVEGEKINPPGKDGSDGYLEILIDELPDPLIGDC